jgi:hypothetical protein
MERKNILTVSQIVNLLFYKTDEITRMEVISPELLREGKRIHSRFGFDNGELYRRFIFHPKTKEWWLILGCPDRVEQKEGKVIELKTYSNERFPSKLKEIGKIQAMLYCWLTGFPKWELWGYSSYKNKVEKEEEGEYNEKYITETILKAIELKSLLQEFKEEYEKKLKENNKNKETK